MTTDTLLAPLIHDRGRGAEFIGTRITINDLFPYLQSGSFTDETICEVLRLSPKQLAAGKDYIAANMEEVTAENARIDERIRRATAEQSLEFRTRFGSTEGRLEYFPTWVKHRELEAANGGSALPASFNERLQEYLRWWDTNRRWSAGEA